MKYFIRIINNIGWFMWIPLAAGLGGILLAVIVAPIFGIPFGAFFIFTFWKLLFGPMVKDERLREIGIEADAKILSIAENGSSIQMGGQIPKPGMTIRLEVHPTDREAFVTTTNAFLSMFEIQNYQPGSSIRVKFDPTKPQSLVILQGVPATGYYNSNAGARTDATASMTQSQVDDLTKKLIQLKQDQKDLLEGGIQYDAKVLSFTDMNVEIPDGGTLVTMRVEVQGPTGPYTAEIMAPVMVAGMGKYQAGHMVFVHVDKNNPHRVALAGSPENHGAQHA
ncbi:MAG: hypothetical protein ABIO72_01405 [Patescibacteria group bacterium]